MEKRPRFIVRLLVAGGAGLAVTLVTAVVGLQDLASSPYARWEQWLTCSMLDRIARAVTVYQQRHETLPGTLDNLRPLAEECNLSYDVERGFCDGWDQPFVYETDGTKYTVTSFGRDGTPGGAGMDCDLTQVAQWKSSAPTFSQLLNEYKGWGLIGGCVKAGVLLAVLVWFLARPSQLTRQKLVALCIKLAVTVVGAIIIGSFLVVLHIPSGH